MKNNKIRPQFASSVSGTTLEILVYEDIGEDYWSGTGVTATAVTNAIKAAGAFDKILVRINSRGGDCFEGVAIYNLLRSQGKPIDVFVDGLAASAASVIAMAGDTINVGVGAMLMIHNAACYAFGDAPTLLKVAATLENISTTVGGIYVKRTKNDAATVKELMDAETWMSADDAVEKGFADAVVSQSEDDSAQAKALAARFDLKCFKNAPAKLQRKGGKIHASVNPDCECDCTACQETGCAGCENDPCTEAGCDCPNHEEMSSEFIPSIENYQQRAALRERLV